MARYVVPVVVMVVLAMVGGYVVGQQDEQSPRQDFSSSRMYGPLYGPAYGHYVPAGDGRMLDTTNGNLYALNGIRWGVAGAFMGAEISDANFLDQEIIAGETELRRLEGILGAAKPDTAVLVPLEHAVRSRAEQNERLRAQRAKMDGKTN